MSEKSNIKVSISGDEYSAYMSLKYEPDEQLNLTDLGPLLKQNGVIFGIKKDILIQSLEKYKNGLNIENVLVAEGIYPFEGIKPNLELKFEISSQPKTDESGRIDYREISKIHNIKKGQQLAIFRKVKQPVDGITVTGKRTSFSKIEDIDLKIKGHIITDEQEDYIYYSAGVDGALTFEDNTLSLLPALEIPEDVDFNVGNVRFNGDIKVGRDVLPDFIVEAEGGISIWGSAIACYLKARDSVDVRAGIVGKNKGKVEAGEDIHAVFVENAQIKAWGDINIKNGIIGGEVDCGGTLKMELPRSRIVGSTIRAAKGIIAYNIGSRFDTSTNLTTGIILEKEAEYLKIKEHLEKKINTAKEIEKKYGRDVLKQKKFTMMTPPQLKSDASKWNLLREDIQVIYQRMRQAESEMYDHTAVIVVKETLFPRVTLKIGRYKMVTSEEHYKVTVKYSSEKDRLVIE